MRDRCIHTILGLALLLAGASVAQAQTTVAGVTSGALSVDETGSAGYTLPIAVPPGIAGMQPSVALVYQSHGGNGTAGVGWGLSAASSIHRCGQTLVQDGAIHGVDFSAADRFCLDGQRLVAIAGSYGADGTEYRTEIESFARIVSHGSAGSGPLSFTVETKSGRTMAYGGTADARLGVPGADEIRLWSLNELEDTLGNAMTYHYVEDTGDKSYRLDRIAYTRNDGESVAPQSEVRFVYEARPDTRSSFLAGAELGMTKRLAAIETWTDTGSGLALVKSYDLAYEASPATARSRLTAVTECDSDGNCLQPMELGWNTQSAIWLEDPDYDLPSSIYSNSQSPQLKLGQLIDVNGDGLSDWVRAYATSSGSHSRITYLNTGGDWQPDAGYQLPSPIYHNQQSPQLKMGDFADVNGDGLVDWIRAYTPSSGSGSRITYLNTGSGWEQNSAYELPSSIYTNAHSPQLKLGEFADVNGDGLPDWVKAYTTSSGSTVRTTYLNTGSGWQEDAGYQLPSAIIDNGQSPQLKLGEFADVNGDGLVDWVMAYSGSPSGRATYLNTGSSWQAEPAYELPSSIYSNAQLPQIKLGEFADVNGDGLLDWVVAYTRQGNYGRATYLNTGSGWQAEPAYDLPSSIYSNAIPPQIKLGEFADVSGDGLVDWVIAYTRPSASGRATHLNTGSGWSENPAYELPSSIVSNAHSPQLPLGEFADVNGDGQVDWVKAYTSNGSPRATYFGPSFTPDLLGSVTDSLGRASTLEYAPLTDGDVYAKDGDAVFPVVDIQAPLYVVKSVSSDDGVGGQKVTSYIYAGAKVHVQGRGFRGFRQMTATDQQTGIVTTTQYSQVFPTTAQVLSSVKTLADGSTTIKTLANTWDALSLNNGDTVWPYVATSVSEDYEPNDGPANTPVVTRTATATFDAYGNPTELLTETVGAGATFTEFTENEYTNDTVNWFLGLLTRSEVTRTRPGAP